MNLSFKNSYYKFIFVVVRFNGMLKVRLLTRVMYTKKIKILARVIIKFWATCMYYKAVYILDVMNFCMLGDLKGIIKLKGPTIYHFKDLKSATRSFSKDSKIGGGLGDVYEVILILQSDPPLMRDERLILQGIKFFCCLCQSSGRNKECRCSRSKESFYSFKQGKGRV